MIDLHVLADRVADWTDEVGKFQLEKVSSKDYCVKSKQTEIDIVTDIDVMSEKMLKEAIWTAYPDHAILGEEDNVYRLRDGQEVQPSEADWQWVLDPIDGTTNFIHGFPLFCISVGLKHQGETVFGMIYAPVLGQRYMAIKGKGAYLNGAKIHVSDVQNLAGSVVATGFPYNRATHNVNQPYFNRVVNTVAGIRRTGSAALDLCFVASGVFEAYWEFSVNEWDICAGVLIQKEAGGTAEELTVDGTLMVIVTNGYIYDELKTALEIEI